MKSYSYSILRDGRELTREEEEREGGRRGGERRRRRVVEKLRELVDRVARD